MGRIKRYRDLRVWQLAMDIVEEIYQLTATFPAAERFGLSRQMREAAISIPSNIAEGHMREHRKEYLHHVSIAHGSLAEAETQIEIAVRLTYCLREQAEQVLARCISLGKQLFLLRNALSEPGTVRTPIPNP